LSSSTPTKKTNKQRRKAYIRRTLRELALADSLFLDNSITQAEDERTVIAKNDNNNKNRTAIDAAHKLQVHQRSLIQQGRNAGYNISTAFRRATQSIKPSTKRVRFDTKFTTRTFNTNKTSALITYDSGAEGHYISEHDRIAAGLPIL
jgi:deoxyribodipyrimidine photolyase